MRIFESIRRARARLLPPQRRQHLRRQPDPAEIKLDDGSTWRNLTTEAKSKVAETLDEFRGAFRYNLLDENVRRFNREVPQVVQWDDHEMLNNWYPGEMLDDPRYAVKSVDLLARRARQALASSTSRSRARLRPGSGSTASAPRPAAGSLPARRAELPRRQLAQPPAGPTGGSSAPSRRRGC